jgi:hypothetical protein
MTDEIATKAPGNGDAAKAGSAETKPPTGEALQDNFEKFSAAVTGKAGAMDAKLLEAIQDRLDEFLGSLTRLSRPKRWWQKASGESDPELLQVCAIIYNHLGEAQRLLTERAADQSGDAERIGRRLLALLGKGRAHADNIHAAWALAGSLEHMLLLLGDDNYIITRLESEREREQKKLPGSWSEYLPVETLDGLLEKYKPGDATGQRARAVESLVFLYARRIGYMRTLRASEEIKGDYLNRLTFVLTILLLLMIETIYLASSTTAVALLSRGVLQNLWSVVTLNFKFDFAGPNVMSALVAAMTGAVGSTLSGFYKLRDATDGIPTLRAFRSAMRAQPFVGATVGVLLMLLIMSGILTGVFSVGGADTKQHIEWLPLAVYCFIAGFSEPFFLGVVQRVAGAADKKAQAAGEGGAQGAAGKAGDDKK